MSLRRFAAQRPVLAAVLCAGFQFLLTMLILKAGLAFAPQAFGTVKLVAFASTILVPLLLVQLLGLWRRVGFGLDRLKPTPIFWASLLPCVVFLSMGVHPPANGSLGGALLMHLVNAFGEELLFRGVIFAVLLSLRKWRAVLISGVLFGSMHLLHGFMGASWSSAFEQAVVTSLAGMMFAAVRYGTGSLWLTVLVHMILNLCIIYSNVELAAGPTAHLIVERLSNVLALAVAAYVVLKRAEPRDALA